MLEQLAKYQDAIASYQQAIKLQPTFDTAEVACQRLLGQTLSPSAIRKIHNVAAFWLRERLDNKVTGQDCGRVNG